MISGAHTHSRIIRNVFAAAAAVPLAMPSPSPACIAVVAPAMSLSSSAAISQPPPQARASARLGSVEDTQLQAAAMSDPQDQSLLGILASTAAAFVTQAASAVETSVRATSQLPPAPLPKPKHNPPEPVPWSSGPMGREMFRRGFPRSNSPRPRRQKQRACDSSRGIPVGGSASLG